MFAGRDRKERTEWGHGQLYGPVESLILLPLLRSSVTFELGCSSADMGDFVLVREGSSALSPALTSTGAEMLNPALERVLGFSQGAARRYLQPYVNTSHSRQPPVPVRKALALQGDGSSVVFNSSTDFYDQSWKFAETVLMAGISSSAGQREGNKFQSKRTGECAHNSFFSFLEVWCASKLIN